MVLCKRPASASSSAAGDKDRDLSFPWSRVVSGVEIVMK